MKNYLCQLVCVKTNSNKISIIENKLNNKIDQAFKSNSYLVVCLYITIYVHDM